MPRTDENAPSSVAGSDILFLRLKTVMLLTGPGRSTIYRMMDDNRFPRPVKVGQRIVAWRRADLERWSQTLRGITH